MVCIITLVVFGVSSLIGTPLELTPNMEMPMFIVTTIYPGAGPEEVQDLVTKELESSVSTLSGLKNVDSRSMENMSLLILEMEYGTDMDVAHTDLQKKLDMAENGLPDEVTTAPTIIEMTMDSMPVIQLAVEQTGDVDLLNYLNDNIVPDFEKITGVAEVNVYGGQESYVQVRLDEQKLRQYGLDMSTVCSMVASSDFSLPVGSADQGSLSLSLRGGVSYPSPEALAKLPLTLKSGDIIHLSDIATVSQTQKKSDSVSRYNGRDAVSMSLTKRASASTNAVTGAVIRQVEQINQKDKAIQLDVIFNQSDEIWNSLWGVIESMILAIAISMVVLYLFLGDIKASLIVGTSMPTSVLVTLIIMSFSGMTFNMLSLGGLTIGVGMMVDNAIVLLDSCFKKRDEHRTFKDAALEGAGIVASAVTASTLTTVVVFLPIALMQGMSGQLFKDVGFTIVFALTASLISALTLVPLLFLKFKPVEKKDALVNRALRKVEQKYAVLIKKSLGHKKLVVLVAVVLLVVSFMLVPFIGVELMPSTDSGQISISISTRPGLKLEETSKIISRVEGLIGQYPDVDRYMVSGSDGGGEGAASFSIYLKDERKMSTYDIVDELRQETKDYLNCDVQVSAASMMSMGGTDTVVVNLIGNDRDKLQDAAGQVKELMYQNPGVVTVTSSLSDGSPQAEIVVDPVKSGAVGLTPVQVMGTLNSMISGKNVTNIRMGDHDYDIWVEFPEDTYQTVGDLGAINLTAPSGAQVPLLDIATIEYSNSPQMITRHNNQYTVSITAQTTTKNAAKINNEVTTAAMGMQLPEGVDHYMGGQNEQMAEEFSAIFAALGTAIFLVFVVMAIQFESMRFSLMVMISVPFSLIGAFLGLLLTRTTISMTSLMGFIMLVGIVVNNAIVLIDYTNQLREGGMKVRNALIKAGRSRLRPILMTTLTTVLGMVPLAVGLGSNGEMMRGMAMVVIGGLSASTILTLVLIPTFYLILSKRDEKNPNLRGDDDFDPEKPKIEYHQELPDDLNQSDDFPEIQPI